MRTAYVIVKVTHKAGPNLTQSEIAEMADSELAMFEMWEGDSQYGCEVLNTTYVNPLLRLRRKR